MAEVQWLSEYEAAKDLTNDTLALIQVGSQRLYKPERLPAFVRIQSYTFCHRVAGAER